MNNMRQKDLRPAPALIEFKGMKFLITDRPSDVTIHHYITELKKNNVNTVVRVCEPSYNTEELEAQGITVKDLAFEDGTFPPQNVVDEWFEILKQNFSRNYSSSSSSVPSFAIAKRFSFRQKSFKRADSTCTNHYTSLENDNNATTTTTIITTTATTTTTPTSTTTTTTTPTTNHHLHTIKPNKSLNNITTTTTTTITTSEHTDDKTTCGYQQNPEACVAVHCVAGLGRAPVLVALALIELGLKYEAAVEMIRDKRRGAINAKQLSYLERYKPKARLKHKNGHKNSCCVQ
ncbi:protein-tyrosine phosphatase 4A family member PRL-1 isoform 1-T5 [Glossina fuscipes fuscipes]